MPRALSSSDIQDFRARLIDAATRQFAAKGRDGVTMRGLAAELGVSAMTPYRYFADKDAILAAVQARAFDRFAAALEAPMAASDDTWARATGVGDAYARFAFNHPDAYRLMFETASPGSEFYPELEQAAARARATMTSYIRLLIEAGVMAGDPELIGHVFWASIHGAVMLKLAGKLSPACDFERIVAEAFRALAQGFSPR